MTKRNCETAAKTRANGKSGQFKRFRSLTQNLGWGTKVLWDQISRTIERLRGERIENDIDSEHILQWPIDLRTGTDWALKYKNWETSRLSRSLLTMIIRANNLPPLCSLGIPTSHRPNIPRFPPLRPHSWHFSPPGLHYGELSDIALVFANERRLVIGEWAPVM